MLNTTHRRTYLDKEAVKAVLSFAQHLVPHYGLEVIRGEQVRCLFHGQDARPSATIKGNFYHCFTCQKNLDSIGFIMAMENCSFSEALHIGAQLTGITTSTSRNALDRTLKRRNHDSLERVRIQQSSGAKYRILASIARLYRRFAPPWMVELDALLDAWLYTVPLWVDLRPLIFSFDNFFEAERALNRLYQENEYREAANA